MDGMTTAEPERVSGTRPLRILEIGTPLFRIAVPEQTDFFMVGRHRGSHPLFGPSSFLRVLQRLRRRHFDVVVVDAPLLPFWHPRSFLTALRNWRLKGPSALFATAAVHFMHHFHDTPLAVFDSNDSFGIGAHNFHLIDRCHSYFKRELLVDRWQVFFKSGHWNLPGRRWRAKASSQRRLAKLRPLSLGCFPTQFEGTVEKTADIFFAGDTFPSSTVRTDGIKELLALREAGIRVDIPEAPLDRPTFLRRMASAWLAWSPAGYGWDCLRHYEAAEVGTVPVINNPTTYRYAPFRDGEHCLFYPVEPGELSACVRRALADKQRLAAIAARAKAHVQAHHTFRARAEHIAITVLGRRLDGSAAQPADAISNPGNHATKERSQP